MEYLFEASAKQRRLVKADAEWYERMQAQAECAAISILATCRGRRRLALTEEGRRNKIKRRFLIAEELYEKNATI